jgi:4-hydroxybenzoate polyprenyltransferase
MGVDREGLILSLIGLPLSVVCAVFVHWGYWIHAPLWVLLIVIYCTPRKRVVDGQ